MSMIDWNQFVNQDSQRIFRYFRARFNHQQSCDLVQEVLIRLHKKIESGEFDAKRGSVMAFAFGLAHFVAREALHKGNRTLEVYSVDDDFLDFFASEELSQEERYLERERAQKLRLAINCLSISEQEIVCLLLDEDLTLAEISVILHLPLNTVKSHMHRAKTKLKDELSKSGVNSAQKEY